MTRSHPHPFRTPLLLAVLFTLLGSLKPMHIDETANCYYAAHIAEHPTDPFGFKVFWYDYPEPANEILTPPVMVSWWAAGVWLLRPFGEQPMLWKLWLLPFTLLFVFSLYSLLRRFARGLETPLLWMTVLGPVILPGLNLMPDIPALAFSLSALVMFLRALETPGAGGYLRAALAGLLTGVAMQSKYTAFLTPPLLGLAAFVFGRLRLWPITALLSVAVFVSWEYVTDRLYGESHFLHQLRVSPSNLLHKLQLISPLISIVGGAAPALGLLGLTALAISRQRVRGAAVVVGIGYLVVACVGVQFTGTAVLQGVPGEAEVKPVLFSLADIIYVFWGIGVFTILVVSACCLCQARTGSESCPTDPRRFHRVEWFLAGWLLLEVVGYFFLTPFPAVRRIMGLTIVATLLTGRLASLTCLSAERRAMIRRIAVFNVLLGLLFLAVDIRDAHAQKQIAEAAAEFIREQPGDGKMWYAGHWGFQYYAERTGMKPLVARQPPWHAGSPLRAGDWLVLASSPIDRQGVFIDPERTTAVYRWEAHDLLPLRTVPGYYGGWTPLEHAHPPRLQVEVRRVLVDHVPPRPPPSP